MKKLTLKIRQNTKAIIFGLAILASAGLTALHPTQAIKSTFAFTGLIATFKSKKIELDAEEVKHFEAIDGVLEANFKGLLSAEDATKQLNELKATIPTADAMKKLNDGIEELNDQYKKAQERIDQLATTGGHKGTEKGWKAQLREQLGSEQGKAAIKAFIGMNSNASLELNVKAATNMFETTTTAYTTATTAIAYPAPEVIPGLNDIARNQPFILQQLNVGGTDRANIIWTEKYNPQGAAGWVGEGVASPDVSFDVRIAESRAKTLAADTVVSIENLDDVDFIESEIQKEIIYQLAIKLDTDLLQGDGIGDNLPGIISFVGGYVLTSFSVTQPNTMDCILACATQIAVDNFRPDKALLNTLDYNNVMALKGNTGYYLTNPNAQGNTWNKIEVISSNQVPVGHVLVMDSTRTNVKKYKDMNITFGWVNDNFKKRLVTIMGYLRIHNFIKLNDTNAFVYDTLTNIKAAIAAV